LRALENLALKRTNYCSIWIIGRQLNKGADFMLIDIAHERQLYAIGIDADLMKSAFKQYVDNFDKLWMNRWLTNCQSITNKKTPTA
jgi:hypothetical protein